jgi:hypothetical protein
MAAGYTLVELAQEAESFAAALGRDPVFARGDAEIREKWAGYVCAFCRFAVVLRALSGQMPPPAGATRLN